MTMATTGARLPNPWEAVGRGTEVGRALFALYNGYGVARNRGNKYSDCNRMKIMERISAEGLPDLYHVPLDPPKPKKPIVKVPHFHKKYITIDNIPQVLLMRGRRKSSQILTQLKEDMSQRDQPPASQKPLLDEKEKARLQEIFEWSGRDVEEEEVELNNSMAPTKPPPTRGSVEEQEMLIEAIANEIEERKTFLDRMFELGQGPKYEPIMRLEIQERVRQMELLDKNITSIDKERFKARTSNHSKHAIKGQDKPNSKLLSLHQHHNEIKDDKIIEFEEQLKGVRKESMVNKEDECVKNLQDGVQDNDKSIKQDELESSSEKSLIHQSISPSNNRRSKYDIQSNPQQCGAMNIDTRPLGSQKSSLQGDFTAHMSMASLQSSKCSSMQSGSIRSNLKSLKSFKSHSSVRSSTLSTPHSTLCM